MRPAKSKLRAVLSGTGDPISCDFAPMSWDIAPLLDSPVRSLVEATVIAATDLNESTGLL